MKVIVPKGTEITLVTEDGIHTIPSEVEIEFRYTHGSGLNMNGDDLTMVYFYDIDKRPAWKNTKVISVKWSIKSCTII